MKRRITHMTLILLLMCGSLHAAQSQDLVQSTDSTRSHAVHPACAFKTNLLMDAATAFNLELEIAMGNHCSLSLPVYYNPFLISRTYTVKMIALQPELRVWFGSTMSGHFLGLHAIAGYYNAYLPNGYRYQDALGTNPCIGGGISYGYSVTLSRSWALEFTLGAGYVYMDYDRFVNTENGAWVDRQVKHYWGPTKAGITLVWRIYGKEAQR